MDPRLAYGRKTCDNRSYSKCQTCLLWVKNREKDFLLLVQNVLLLLLRLELDVISSSMGPKISLLFYLENQQISRNYLKIQMALLYWIKIALNLV